MQCPQCQFDNVDGAKFCNECGCILELSCLKCSKLNPPASKFCNECGSKLTPLSEKPINELSFDEKLTKIQKYLPKGLTKKILSQRGRIEGERKQVTVLFCDMEGFTALSERIGPDGAYSIMDQIYEILIHKVHDYEGTVNEMTGDGIMALFGAPIAMEDAPQRAIRSALAIHQEVGKFNDRMKENSIEIPQVKMRVGIHTGAVVVGTMGNDLRVEFKAVGDTVNTASRMEELAEPGTVYVSDATFKLAEGLFQFEALGEKKVKGKEAPVMIYRVLGITSRRTRFDVSAEQGLTPFVGRERELELLIDGFERAKDSRGQALSIMGEAGLGKSRLLYEFRKAVANEDVTYLEGKCLSFSSNVAYHPVIDVLKSNFFIGKSDGDAVIAEKVKRNLKSLGEDEALSLPYFLELLSVKQSSLAELSLSPETMRDRIIEGLKRILIKGSQRRPLIIAIEDLHWADKSSEEAFKSVLDSISGAKVFIIFTYRPEFVHSWGARSYHSQVNLNRLSNRQSLAMATNLLGTKNIDRALEDVILEKTEGVPFFIEEFIKSLMSLKIIERKDNAFFLVTDAQTLTIPATIQDVIMARVDMLPEGAKEMLQTGSVIEREFSYDLIKTVTGIPEQELLSHLSALKDFELLYERGIYPHSTYIFKHALTREVAYNSLLIKRRKEVHSKVAGAIELLYSERLEEFYEKLANHYFESDNYEKARDYLKFSGDKAVGRFSNMEAFRFYKKLIHVLNQLPESEEIKKEQINTRLLMFTPMRFLAYPDDSLIILEEGARLSKDIGNVKDLITFNSLIGKLYTFNGDPLKGLKYQEECYHDASKTNDIDLLAPVADDLVFPYKITGQVYKVVEKLPKVINMLEEENKESEFFNRTTCVYPILLGAYGNSLAALGNFKDGKYWIEKSLSHAQKLDHTYTTGWAEYINGEYYWIKGNARNTILHIQNCINCFEKAKADVYLGMAWAMLGLGYYLQDDLDKALKFVQKGLEIQNSLGIPTMISNYYIYFGLIQFAADEIKASQINLETALSLSQKNNEKYMEALAWILLGRTLGRADTLQRTNSEVYILKGIETFKKLKFKTSYSLGFLFLGELHSILGQRNKALEYLKKAEDNFRDMEMDYWLGKTQDALGKF